MSNEQEIEAELIAKGLNAPRLSPDKIDAVIISATYTTLPSGRAMICELLLKNGYVVRGESACISIENFDKEIGKQISYEDARRKVWGLEAYRLTQELFDQAEMDKSIAELTV